ncbi:MAG: guanylate kinase [Spirochaetales bacterium]
MFMMLIGSSGVGKNTLIKALKQQNKKVVLMPTLTARPMRNGEKQGNPYYFYTKEEFQEKIKNNELLEYELIHGNYYGSSKLIFDDYIKKGKILVKDIGVEGAVNLSRLLKDYTKTIQVFLKTKNKQVLVKRLKERGETEIKKRLKRYKYEQGERYKFDFIILNKTINQTVELLKEILKNENELANYVFTKPVEKLRKKKIKALSEEYSVGYMPSAIRVALKDGKIYVLKGHEELVASIIAGVTICKEVYEGNKIKTLTESEMAEWKNYLRAIELEVKQKD